MAFIRILTGLREVKHTGARISTPYLYNEAKMNASFKRACKFRLGRLRIDFKMQRQLALMNGVL